MNYSLLKLAFDSPVHFGASDSAQGLSDSDDHICSDTLFSALCHTALQMYGEEGLNELCTWVREGSLILSDTMPWHGDDFYIPKPYIHIENKEKPGEELPASKKKAMKKLAWLPVSNLPAFSDSVHGGKVYDPDDGAVSFGIHTERTRINKAEGEDPLPYSVGLYQFEKDCGLYVIAASASESQSEKLSALISALGLSGIGGKISSGCGRFHIEDEIFLNEPFDRQTEWLYKALTEEKGKQLLISASLPKEEELEKAMENADFQIIRRSGFVSSDTYSATPLKKDTQYFFKSGSVFSCRFEGDLYSVGHGGSHPVYRYGKPMFLGVNI